MSSFLLNKIFDSEIDLSNRVNEVKPDFYYAIFPLIVQLEGSINNIFFSQLDFTKYIPLERRKLFIENLAGQINFYIKEKLLAYTLIHELEIAKEAKLLEGNNSSDKFSFFIKKISNNHEWISYYFEKYPLLEKRLQTQIENILIHVKEIAERILKDISDLEQKFDTKINFLNNIQLFLGDMHKKGRTVSIVTFNNQFKIVYKPRSLNNEESFKVFFQYLNKIGAKIKVGFPKILSRKNYGWMEFIEHKEAENIDKIDSYYYNLGKILCVFYLLGTHDIMPDNVILKGDVPYFIDLECLLNKPIKSGYSMNNLSKIFQSVLSVGILPFWAQGNSMERDLMRSVLYGANKQKIKSTVWANKNTDIMNQEVKEVFAGDGSIETHLPLIDGEQHELNYNYYLKLKKGFVEQYKFLQQNKTPISIKINDDVFKDTFIRFVIHNTSIYDLLLRESILPETLQGIDSIKPLIERIFHVAEKPLPSKLSKSIIEQISTGDIPYFYTFNVANTSLFDGHETVISKKYYDEKYTGSYMAIERLKNLSDEDLDFQVNIIDISCKYSFEVFSIESPSVDFVKPKKWKHLVSNNYRHFNKNDLLEVSNQIGQSLKSKVYFNKHSKEYNWIWKNRDVDGRWGCLPLNLDLYDGLSGMSYFYLYLYKYTQNKDYKDIAEITFFRMKETFLKMKNHFLQLSDDLVAVHPISPYSFPFSIVFLMEHFSSVLGNNYWDHKIIKLFYDVLERFLSISINTDFLLGQTGLIQLLLSIPSQENDIVSGFMKKCISNIYLLSERQHNGSIALPYFESTGLKDKSLFLGGFAHGSSGISAILLRYGAIAKDTFASTIGFDVLKHDRQQYIKEINGWRDGREGLDKFDSGCWCHGSAGVALSRLLILENYSDEEISQEITIAKENVLKRGVGGNQSLCHGDMGNLEILRAISSYENDGKTKNFVNNYLNLLILKYKSGKSFKTGEDGSIPLLNLFMGEAGIGYGFLRQYDWENVPSVLSLESSKNEFTNLHSL